MPTEFKLPDLGEGIHEAQIVNVLVHEGDIVSADQMVLEVETDKAAVELPVPYAGRIEKLHVKTGDTVRVGEVLLSVASESDAAPAPAPARPAARAAEAPTPDPAVTRPEPAVAAVGGDGSTTTRVPVRSAVAVAEAPRREGPVPAAPAVRRLAREMGVDLHVVHGTGPGGRVVREDVERFALAGPAGAVSVPSPTAAPTTTTARAAVSEAARAGEPGVARGPAVAVEPLPDFSHWGPVRREAVPQIRKTIARQMTRAYTIIPHVTHGDEVDVTDLEAFRKEHGAVFADQGVKLTLTAFILKAVAGALAQHTKFNCSYDDAAGEIIHKDYIHIGVAVDTPRGLMVPVIRDVDRKSLMRISAELKQLSDRAREFKIDLAELRGGTFTVTNVGALGGTMSTPMINYPEVAILGMGKLEPKPVVRDGQIVARKMLPLFLSFDHRVIDGADAARFLRTVMTYLENPLNLLLVS